MLLTGADHFRRDDAHDTTPLLHGRRLDFTVALTQRLDDLAHDAVSLVDVGDLTAAKDDRYLHLVLVFERSTMP